MFSSLYEYAHGKGEPERDPRLDLAAAELSAVAAQGAPLDDELVAFALRQHGVLDAAVLALAVDATEPSAIVAQLTPQLGDRLFFGNVHIGIGGMTPMVLVVTHTSLVTLEPGTPRFVEAHGDARIAMTLDPSFHAPHITISHDDASSEKVAGNGPWRFHCGDHTGTQWLLFEARDAKEVDTRLLAFPIDCATHSPDVYRIEPRSNVAVTDVERRLASLINRERAGGHLTPLADDRRAAEAARTQVQMMRASERIEHDLVGTTMATRLRDAGLVPPNARELTLHAADLATASELLMNEPAYRDAVMAPDVTHLGIAVARDAHGELYIAVEFVAIVPVIDVARLRTEVLARVRARLPFKVKLPNARVLDEVAQKYAQDYAAGWPEADMVAYTKDDAQLMYSGYEHVQRAMTLLLADSIDKVDLGPGNAGEYDRIGLGIVQAPRNGALAGRVWVVLLFARARR